MRYVVTRLLKNYTFRLADGDSGDCMDGQIKDQFVPNPGSLHLLFVLREEEN